MDQLSNMVWKIKMPRYAHLAKHHELQGEFAEADYNYNMLLEAQKQRLGEEHPDLASVLYELAKLNLFHDIEHDPAQHTIYNSLGRGGVAYMYYSYVMQIRHLALGEEHTAYAQSLYGMANFYKLMGRGGEATPLLQQALKIQAMESDPLPSAQTILCLADVTGEGGDLAGAINLYGEALKLLALPSASLETMKKAAELCDEANATSDDNEAAWELIEKARSLQSSLADPYFEMTFQLMEAGGQDLMAMVLELHRKQYAGEFRAARLEALKHLAEAYRKTGKLSAAIPLLQEVAEMLENEP